MMNAVAPPAIFYDRDLNAENVTTLGCYDPAQHEERHAIQALLSGEGTESGIASSKEVTVILTNLACYLFRAEEDV